MKSPKLFARLMAHACAALLLLNTAPSTVAQRRQHATPPPTRPSASAPAARPNAAAPRADATQTPAQTPAASSSSSRAQQARRPEPDLSIEELLAADAYTVYAEAHRVGTLSQAEEVKSAVASLRLLGGEETKPLTDLYAFVNENAEALGESRVVLTFLPARAGLPQALVSVELASPEAAVAFEPKFRRLLGEQVRQVRKAIDPQSAPPEQVEPRRQGARQKAERPASDFALRRVGRWLIAADSPFTLKRLRGEEGEPRLADSTRFQTVRSRFANDSLFIYVDTNVAQQGWALQVQRTMEAQPSEPKQPEAVLTARVEGSPVEIGVVAPTAQPPAASATPGPAATPGQGEPTPEQSGEDDEGEDPEMSAKFSVVEENLSNVSPPPAPTEQELAVRGLDGVMRNLWGGVPRIPGAVALGVSLDRGALAVRLAVENTPDGTIAVIPFLPNVVSGPPVTADSASVAPADAELFVAASLDWTHVFNSTLGAASVNPEALAAAWGGDEGGEGKGERPPTADQAIAAVEKLFGFKFREDLLPSLGNEVAVSMPLAASDFGLAAGRRSGEKKEDADAEPGPLYIAALNNAEKMREILPHVLVAFGLVSPGDVGGAPEKRAGHEIHAAGSLSYTIINNFLVLGEMKAVRHCVDSFESRQTLAASNAYRDATSWQAKQKLVHLFLSDAILKNVVEETKKRSGGSTDPSVLALFAQLETAEYAPASYEATNEGDVLLHEMRLPLSLIRSYALAMTVAVKDAPVTINEGMAVYMLQRIADAESSYKDEKKKGRYGSLEELLTEKLLEKEFMDHMEYKVELNAGGDKFEVTATPKTYGKTGRRSFFIDETGKVRAADRKGQPATSADPTVEQ